MKIYCPRCCIVSRLIDQVLDDIKRSDSELLKHIANRFTLYKSLFSYFCGEGDDGSESNKLYYRYETNNSEYRVCRILGVIESVAEDLKQAILSSKYPIDPEKRDIVVEALDKIVFEVGIYTKLLSCREYRVGDSSYIAKKMHREGPRDIVIYRV